ncbi:MAG TPA: hypothetical protein VJ023_03795 [Pyrinomonadaceae bacterium]|nr:hypothetical protein [Pyrinomonadaceae bacterium]
MDELIKQITEKTGISEEQARTAANTVIGFLKSRLPEPIAGQLDNLTGQRSAGGLSDVASKVGGLFNQ